MLEKIEEVGLESSLLPKLDMFALFDQQRKMGVNMRGYIRRRGCTCKKKKCTCGAKWSFTVDVGSKPDGSRKQKTISGFKTKDEAEDALTKLHNDLINGTYIEESDILFKDFVDDWLKLYCHNVKRSTLRVRKHESGHLIAKFSNIKLKNITKKMYQEALLDLKQSGLAENTLSGIHGTGRMIFKKAKEYDLIKVDPTEYARIPRTVKTVEHIENSEDVPKYLEKEDLALFLRTAKEKGLDSDYTVFLTLAYSGIRIGELCALMWKDIDFDNKTISITKTLYNPNNNSLEYELLSPKTTKSVRIIDMDELVISELENNKSQQNIIKMRLRNTWHDKGFVFSQVRNYHGYPWYLKKIENRMNRLLKLAGLNHSLTPHSLRHTHTSLLAEAGASLEEIMDRLGHQDDDTTKRIYLHVTKAKKKEASQKFSALMRNLL